jgi:hypothetical protein
MVAFLIGYAVRKPRIATRKMQLVFHPEKYKPPSG